MALIPVQQLKLLHSFKQVEKEFAGLPKQAAQRSGMLSPRQPPADQPWTSRLADNSNNSLPALVPVAEKPLSSPNSNLSPGGNAAATVVVEAPSKPPPRMADTILQV